MIVVVSSPVFPVLIKGDNSIDMIGLTHVNLTRKRELFSHTFFLNGFVSMKS